MHPSVPLILRVSQIQGFGLAGYWKLCEAFGSLERAIERSCSELAAVISSNLSSQVLAKAGQANSELIEATLTWCQAHNVAILSHLDSRYPSRLREIRRAPPILYVKGNVAALAEPQIAIVGSRSSSQTGKSNAYLMAEEMAQAGLAVTSGLALGIDTQAHRGALAASGTTLAVVGNGIDTVYPSRNRPLADEILAENGAIISEFPLRVAPSPENFPRRNRIISGMSVGTLVIEAALKSGSLITARYALEQNREVFAMPGSIHNPLSRGCHYLIKQGAVLVESPQDILHELEGFVAVRTQALAKSPASPIAVDLSEDERHLLETLEHCPCNVDELALRSALPVEKLLANLMSLELMGLVSSEDGCYSLAPKHHFN